MPQHQKNRKDPLAITQLLTQAQLLEQALASGSSSISHLFWLVLFGENYEYEH